MNKYHKVYDFENGYGASVVWGPGTYGYDDKLFEVAILKNGDLCYDTPISSDVVGYLDFAGVAEILEKIKNLS